MSLSQDASARLWRWLSAALFLAALLPRLAAVNRYITPDELAWVYRSVQFRQALLDGQWADTLITGHPGVTTTWLGALGISVQLVISPADQFSYEWISRLAWLAPDNVPAFSQLATFLTAGRLGVILINSLGVAAIFLLARPLLGRRAALLGALLVAWSPFAAGLGGLLHVDGLAATFTTLSLLVLCRGVCPNSTGHAWRPLAAAGALAALAALSKSSVLLLGPFSGLAWLAWLVAKWRAGRQVKFALLAGFGWAGGFLLAATLTLPAVWAAPQAVADVIGGAAGRYAGEALHPLFFLGRYTADPGSLFYPLALAFRLSPLVFAGVMLALGQLAFGRLRQPLVGLFLLWALLFVAMLAVPAQKFARYALPAVFPLALTAGLAWDYLSRRWRRSGHFISFLVVLQGVYLVSTGSYPLAAFNPLLGGASTAEKIVPVGWGEGVSAAARWLAEQPGTADRSAVSGVAPALAPFFPGRVLVWDAETVPQADYVILTVGDRQVDPGSFEQVASNGTLVHTVRFAGRAQAWVYQQASPWPADSPVPALPEPLSFGRRVQLLGAAGHATPNRVYLLARWALQQIGGRYTVKLDLLDEEGRPWGSLETPLLNEVYFYPQHWATDETPEMRYTLDLPAGIPPASYTLALSLFDAESGGRLPVLGADGTFHGAVYTLEGVVVPPVAAIPGPAAMDIPRPLEASFLGGALTLLGHGGLPAGLGAGEGLTVDLFWRAERTLSDGLQIKFMSSQALQLAFPLSRYLSGLWRAGEFIHEKYTLPLPPEMPAGRYPLQLDLAGQTVTLGEIEVASPDRLMQLPVGIAMPLDLRLGESLRLRGFELATPTAVPGGSVQLTLYWQAVAQPAGLYTAFVHLLGPDGAIVAQDDRWPGYSPSNTWAAGQVIVDAYAIALPPSAPAGGYQIAVGLYDPMTGDRLIVWDAAGNPAGDRVILPDELQIVEPADG